MRKKLIIAHIKKLCKDFYINDFKIILDYKLNIGNGYCDNYYDSNKEIHIGAKELKGFFNTEIPNELFVKLVVNIYHETRHYKQQANLFENTIQYDKYIFYNYLACAGSSYGYYNPIINPYNYYNNIRELDAEFSGIKNAYVYLSTIFTSQEAENLIVNYVNNRLKNTYYISMDKSASSLIEIATIFDKTMRLNIRKIRQYNINYISQDKPVQYIQNENNEFILQVNELHDGIDQDKLLAGAYIKYLEDNRILSGIINNNIYITEKEDLLLNPNKFIHPTKENEIDINLD